MNTNQPNEQQRREFDWGPPASSFSDSFKEWLVYILLFLLLVLIAWFFWDVGARRHVAVKVNARRSTPAQTQSVPFNESQKSAIAPSGRYMVQLGAFADRKSAETAFSGLKEQGFLPTLSEPDDEFEIYRVSLGPFESESIAEQTVEKLNSLNLHSFVVESF